jgi:hypothetical protein
MKTILTLKSLADIPAHALSHAASIPGRAMGVSRQVLGPAVRVTRREIRAARRSSEAFARELYARAHAPFRLFSHE